MILEFKCSNFRSINSEIDFNMQATADKKFEENLIEFDGKKFLKSAEIYGPNGSGKSTLLTAIRMMKSVVCLSNNKGKDRDDLPSDNHKLNPNAPTVFSMWFEKNKKKFFYEFSFTKEKIIEENLYFADSAHSKKMITVFERDENAFVPGERYKQDFGNCDKELKPKKLLLSIASDITQIEPVMEAFDFYENDIVYWSETTHEKWTKSTAKVLKENPEINKAYVDIFSKFCPGLKSISANVDTKIFSKDDIPEDLPISLKQSLIEKGVTTLDVKFNYENFSTNLREESEGTRVFFDLLSPLLVAMKKNAVLICDELETHLHPALVKEILRIFYGNATSSAQFIFTTHNLELLDQDIIRRDQIWFTELKPETRETILYSLAEYNGVRNDENLRRGYIEHRYGSWPNIEKF